MITLNQNQKDVKKMFDTLNSKKTSSKKYEEMLQKIGKYAESVKESEYFRQIVKDDLLSRF